MLCSVCKLQTQRRVIGQTVREVCKNPKCRLNGVPQGEPLIIPQEVAQEEETINGNQKEENVT